MSAAAQRALHKAITSGSFDPAYLFYGENDFAWNDGVDGVVVNAKGANDAVPLAGTGM